jgi:nucleoside-diphosphate-sugar epimerase
MRAEGADVRVLARPSPRADKIEAAGSTVIRGDLSEVSGIQRAVEGAEVVFHVAAKVNPPRTKADFFETNAGGTERVLREALAG